MDRGMISGSKLLWVAASEAMKRTWGARKIGVMLEMIAKLKLVSGDKLLSLAGLSLLGTKNEFYEPRVVRFGGVNREIGVLPGEFRGASFTIELDNTDQWFSKIKAAEVVRRRPVELWIGDTEEGVDDFELIAVGRVRNWTGRDVIQLSL